MRHVTHNDIIKVCGDKAFEELREGKDLIDLVATMAAEVAKEYIERAFYAGLARTYPHENPTKDKETWLKENGITE